MQALIDELTDHLVAAETFVVALSVVPLLLIWLVVAPFRLAAALVPKANG